MRRYKNSRDVILGLLAYGYAIDEDVAQRAYVLETGAVVLSGSAADLARNQDVRRAYLGEM